MSEKLAVEGGVPVRDQGRRPWTRWPLTSDAEWRDELEPALRRVYESRVEGIKGPEQQALGREFAAFCGSRYGLFVGHGTDALAAALVACLDLDGVRPGGEVIVPNYTFVATASCAVHLGCPVCLVDIDAETLGIDPASLREAIKPGVTAAVIPVHLAGHPVAMDEILQVAREFDLAVIEDCAQAHGARYRGKPVGSMGHVGAFSCQSTKNLCSGEGGLAVTEDEELFNRIHGFMDVGRHPRGDRWRYPRLGPNLRPSEYLAALLRVRLRKLPAQIERRGAGAALLARGLGEIDGVAPPRLVPPADVHAYHLYAIQIDPAAFGGRDRGAIVEALTAEGLPAMAGYETPLSEQPAFVHLRKRYPDRFRVMPSPVTERVCANSIWLPQELLLGTEEDMADVVRIFRKVRDAYGR